MADRVNIADAERELRSAGYTVDREQHPNVNNGDPVFLAVRRGQGLPTKLEVHRTAAYGLAVSHRTVQRLARKGGE